MDDDNSDISHYSLFITTHEPKEIRLVKSLRTKEAMIIKTKISEYISKNK